MRRLALTALVLAGLAVAAPASAAPRVTDLGVAFAGRLGSSTTAARPLGDRIVVGLGSGGLVVLDPRRRFARTQRVDGLKTTALAVADLDGDGHRDVIVGGRDGRDTGTYLLGRPRLAVRYGRADGTLGAERLLPFPTGQSPSSEISTVRVADLDGDGHQDLVTGLSGPVNGEALLTGLGVSVIQATGPRRFAVVDQSTTLKQAGSILVADVTGDGRRDLIADGRRLRGRGDGRFGRPDGRPIPLIKETLLVDLIGDRRRDLVLVDEDRAFVRRGMRDGFAAQRTAVAGTALDDSREDPYGDAALVDLDGDGRRELVISGRTSVDVLRGRRRRALGSEVTFGLPAGVADRAMVVIDVDGDDRRDLVSVRSDGRMDVLRNRGLRGRSRPQLLGAPVAVPVEGAGLLRTACSRGVGHCTGGVVLRDVAGRKVADFYIDLRPGEIGRDTFRFPAGRVPTGALRITVAGVGVAPDVSRRPVAAPQPADLRAFCRETGYVAASSASGVVVVGALAALGAAACEFATGRVTVLELGYADGPFAIRGAYAAGVGRSCGDGLQGCVVEVLVTSLRRRRTITAVATTPVDNCSIGDGGDCGDAGVSGLIVGRGGAVAWITCQGGSAGDCGHSKTVRTVHMALAGGKRVEVAASRHIRARSLSLATDGRSFSYDDDAGPHSVAFTTT